MKLINSGWLFAAGLAIAPPLLAADVIININGKVVAKPCTISTPQATIDLGDLYTFNLLEPGSTSAWQSVMLELNNCPVGTSRVSASFSGATDKTGYYKNQGTARNVQLELQDENGVSMNNGSTTFAQVDNATQSIRIPLKVRALTVNGGSTQGTLQAVINVTYTWS